MSESSRASGLTRSEHLSQEITATEPPKATSPTTTTQDKTGQFVRFTPRGAGIHESHHRDPPGHPGLGSPSAGRIPDTKHTNGVCSS